MTELATSFPHHCPIIVEYVPQCGYLVTNMPEIPDGFSNSCTDGFLIQQTQYRPAFRSSVSTSKPIVEEFRTASVLNVKTALIIDAGLLAGIARHLIWRVTDELYLARVKQPMRSKQTRPMSTGMASHVNVMAGSFLIMKKPSTVTSTQKF